jgi:hypothetical protein
MLKASSGVMGPKIAAPRAREWHGLHIYEAKHVCLKPYRPTSYSEIRFNVKNQAQNWSIQGLSRHNHANAFLLKIPRRRPVNRRGLVSDTRWAEFLHSAMWRADGLRIS